MGISHKRDRVIKGGRSRKKRPKTFKTEAALKAYAEKNKITNYDILNLKGEHSKKNKLRLVAKNA